MKKNPQFIIKNINKKLLKNKTKLEKKLNKLKGGGVASAPSLPEKTDDLTKEEDAIISEDDKIEKARSEKEEQAKLQAANLEKRIKEAAESITISTGVSIISIQAKMNLILCSSFGISFKDLSDSATSSLRQMKESITSEVKNTGKEVAAVLKDKSKEVSTEIVAGFSNLADESSELLDEIPDDTKESISSSSNEVGESLDSAGKEAYSAVSNIPINIDVGKITDALTSISSALQPVFEVGASIPGLGICLLLVSKLTTQLVARKQLKELIEDIKDSVKNCLLLIKLIKTTMITYKTECAGYYSARTKILTEKMEAEVDASKKNKLNEEIRKLFKEISFFSKIQLKPVIETKVTAKIESIMFILKKFIPGDLVSDKDNKSTGILSRGYNSVKSGISKLKSQYTMFASGKFYKEEILKHLNVVNNLLIVYNSQFDWAQSSFIMRLKTKKEGNMPLLDSIWKKIEESEDFKNYLWSDEDALLQPSTTAKPPLVENKQRLDSDSTVRGGKGGNKTQRVRHFKRNYHKTKKYYNQK